MESSTSHLFLPVQKQTNGFNYGLFALRLASVLLNDKSPIDTRFVVSEMRNRFIKCLKEVCLCLGYSRRHR